MKNFQLTFRNLTACRGTVALLLVFLGVLTTPAQAQTPVVRFQVERFVVEGENPLTAERTQEVLAPFIGKHTGVDGLLAAADALEQAIDDAGVGFQRVLLPPQSLLDGEVVLRVAVFKVTRIEVRGGQHHSEANILRSVPALKQGETPDTGAIARSLAAANRQPWKDTTLTFRESESEAEGLEATLDVEDSRPWFWWSGLNNTGTAPTGRGRLSLGGSFGNLFDRDHVLNLSYTTSPGHAGQVKQWAVGYDAPVYAFGGTVSGYYVRSDVDTGRVFDTFDVSGAGVFGGLFYTQELTRRGRWSQRLSVGIEDRHFDNDLLVAGVNFAPPPVRSRPISLGYGGQYSGDDWGLDLNLRYLRNLGAGSDNNATSYRLNRDGSDDDWDAWRGVATLSLPLPARWTMRGILEGQYAGEAFIASEQFGVGGAYSVRGFPEREVLGDNGIRTSIEFWSPTVGRSDLRFLLFTDTGQVRFEDAVVPPSRRSETIASVGAGMRWNWGKHLSLQFDIGAITEGTDERRRGARGHLNVLFRY